MRENLPARFLSPRCGAHAKTTGKPCRQAAVRGRKRCRMHGGTNYGPPKGSQNALKHGLTTREYKARKSALMTVIKAIEAKFAPPKQPVVRKRKKEPTDAS